MADELLQMFQSITTSDHDELVDQFAYLLELDHDTATFFLESSNWNVEVAVNNYLATMEAQEAAFGRTCHNDEALYNDQGDDLDMEDGNANQHGEHGSSHNQVVEYKAQFVSDLTPSQTALFPPNAVVNMVRLRSSIWLFVGVSCRLLMLTTRVMLSFLFCRFVLPRSCGAL